MTRIGWTKSVCATLTPRKTDRSGWSRSSYWHAVHDCLYLPVTATIKPFLSNKGHSAEDVENMYQAWFKSITLQVTLMPKMHISNLEVLMEFVGVFLVFLSVLSVVVLAMGLLFLQLCWSWHRLLSIKSLSSTMLSQRCLTFVPEVIYRWWWTINCISPGLMPLHTTQRHQHRNVLMVCTHSTF